MGTPKVGTLLPNNTPPPKHLTYLRLRHHGVVPVAQRGVLQPQVGLPVALLEELLDASAGRKGRRKKKKMRKREREREIAVKGDASFSLLTRAWEK